MNVPLGVLAIAAALLAIPESRDAGASRRVDVPGALLSGAGIFFLVFALVESEKLGWGSAAILGSLALSAALLLAFVLVEKRVREPLVDLSLFGDRLFAAGNALRGLVLFVLLGTVFVLPLYWQTQLGYTALESALVLLPLSVASFFLSPVAGSLADRMDVRWLVGFGFALTAASAFWLSRFSAESGWAFFVVPLALFGAGLAFLFAPTITATLRNVPEEKSGVASGIATASGEIGAALGLAVVAAVLQNRLLANVEDSLEGSGLPPAVGQEALSGITAQTLEAQGVDAAPGGPAAAQVGDLIRESFAGAVSSGLLLVSAAALLGAVLALAFFDERPGDAPHAGNEKDTRTSGEPPDAHPALAEEGANPAGGTAA